MVITLLLGLRKHRERRTAVPKATRSRFWEDDCAAMTGEQFKSHFRLERATFDLLLRSIRERLESGRPQGRKNVAADKALAFLLWRLSSGQESYRAIGVRFGKLKLFLSSCFKNHYFTKASFRRRKDNRSEIRELDQPDHMRGAAARVHTLSSDSR